MIIELLLLWQEPITQLEGAVSVAATRLQVQVMFPFQIYNIYHCCFLKWKSLLLKKLKSFNTNGCISRSLVSCIGLYNLFSLLLWSGLHGCWNEVQNMALGLILNKLIVVALPPTSDSLQERPENKADITHYQKKKTLVMINK